MAHKFSHQACGTVLSSHYCVKKMSWSLNVVMTSWCYVSAGPLHPSNLLNQNEVNIMQWYSQMSGTNKPEWASVLLFWSMYTFSWVAIKHFWLDLTLNIQMLAKTPRNESWNKWHEKFESFCPRVQCPMLYNRLCIHRNHTSHTYATSHIGGNVYVYADRN